MNDGISKEHLMLEFLFLHRHQLTSTSSRLGERSIAHLSRLSSSFAFCYPSTTVEPSTYSRHQDIVYICLLFPENGFNCFELA